VQQKVAARAEAAAPALAAELRDLGLTVRVSRSLVASARHGVREVGGPADVPAATV